MHVYQLSFFLFLRKGSADEVRQVTEKDKEDLHVPGIRCPYLSRVIEMLACPMYDDRALALTPAAIISDA